jgi:signal transduction histidine kinase/CheY-like chemotaxis protein
MMMQPQTEYEAQFNELAALEKLQYMHDYAKSSTIATVLAPLLCIPLYKENTPPLLFNTWFALMTLAVVARHFLIKKINISRKIETNFLILHTAIASVTLTWGLGWFIFVQHSDIFNNYLLYEISCLTILFVGMVGYCVNWKTFCFFVVPLKVPELIFLLLNYELSVWPIATGSMVAFYLALKMSFLFSRSWEKSFSLRLKNDRLFDQLTAEKNASNAANIAKSEFIATASHDLRQPMQSINIFIEMIDDKNLKEQEGTIFSRMRNSVSVLNKMFNTLLDISKLDSNFSLTENHFSLHSMVENLKNTFTDLCVEKNLNLIFAYQNCLVTGDAHLTEQILRNLLSNAIQYTERGNIIISFSHADGCLMFEVEDSGCGIPSEDISLIFKEFYRSEHSRAQYDGLGLGLSIVSRIVKKISGDCVVQSEVGKGSIFTIKTPFKTSNTMTDLQVPTLTGDSTERMLERAPTHANLMSEESLTRHLGVIENDYSLKEAYLQYFTNAGYQVHMIPHQENEFVDYLKHIPKLSFILSDFRLGEKDGIFFIQQLREEFNDEIPACIVTADTSPQHLELFDEHNIDVLYKPISIKQIDEFISKNLQIH